MEKNVCVYVCVQARAECWVYSFIVLHLIVFFKQGLSMNLKLGYEPETGNEPWWLQGPSCFYLLVLELFQCASSFTRMLGIHVLAQQPFH